MRFKPAFLKLLKKVRRVAGPPRWAGAAIIGLGLCSALLEGIALLLFMPLIQSLGAPREDGAVQRVLERFLQYLPEEATTAWLIGIVCLLILAKNAVNVAAHWVTKRTEGIVAHRLRKRVFQQVLSSCIDYRPETRRSDIATSLTNHCWQVATALNTAHGIVLSLVTFVIFVIIMFSISPALSAVSLICLMLMGYAVKIVTRRVGEVGGLVVAENRNFGIRMWESMHALKLIRSFGREEYEIDRFNNASNFLRLRLLHLDILSALPGSVSDVAITFLIGALILSAEYAEVGVAALAAFLSLLYRLQRPTREILRGRVSIEGASAAVADVDDLLRMSQIPFLKDGPRAKVEIRQGLEFRNVWFRYGSEEGWALKDVSLLIPAGKTTAFVGRSGAGKSTLLALLMRLYDPVKGSVRVGGVPLDDFVLSRWRETVAIMDQEVQLLNDTIVANIAYGRPDASRVDIERAANIAFAHDFIQALPSGYDTVIGDQGFRLSGGQRQRIALARTVLRDPPFLILDEATNALDAVSEAMFQKALDRFAQGRTLVVVAHRLSTVKNADQVVVIDDGRIVEVGPPNRLIGDAGEFAQMMELQQGSPSGTPGQIDGI